MKKFAVIFFLAIFFSLSLFSSGVVDSMDGFLYLAVARNIYYKGKPTAPIYEYSERKNIHLSTYVGKDGDTYSLTGLGYSLALVPSVAITDLIYKLYNVNPPIHFPLENDWLILFSSSFTNTFFGALLTLVLFFYFQQLNIQKKTAFYLTLVGIFSTNLLVYTKHSFAHMMFLTFLVMSFYFLKKYSKSNKSKYLIFSGAAYGVYAITYNFTFVLSIPALLLYYYLLLNPKLNKNFLKDTLKNLAFFLLGLTPFILTYLWFENLRVMINSNATSSSISAIKAAPYLFRVPISVFIEGVYGQLFSPGRCLFIYSPLLLIIIFFWFKIKKSIRPELSVFLILLTSYIFFYSSLYTPGSIDQGISGLWHGESSWGPRYLTPLIPFGMLIVGFIFTRLSKFQKRFVFLPLMLIGIYIEILGVIFPYQIKFHNTVINFFINGTNYTNYVYTNLLPRYMPVFAVSKDLIKLPVSLAKTLDHGPFAVRFYDGIDFPFNVGHERWRTINGEGLISFDNSEQNPVKTITFGMINHPVSESSASALLSFKLNGSPLSTTVDSLKATERKILELSVNEKILKPKDNNLVISVHFDNPKIVSGQQQILGLIDMGINGKQINKESIDVPYISPLGPAITKVNYLNYGGINKDPWLTWEIHTQIFERTPDFWWIKPLYYWDYPRKAFLILLILNIILAGYFSHKTLSLIKSADKK